MAHGIIQPQPALQVAHQRVHNGQPQPRAALTRAQHPVERIDDPRALLGRNAGAIVLHGHHHLGTVPIHPQINLAAGRRVADGVVHQVAQQRVQRHLVGGNPNPLVHLGIVGDAGGCADAQIEPLLIRQWQQVLQHATHDRQDGHDGGGGSCRGRGLPLNPARVLCPRQQQKLLQQVPTAPDARLQRFQALGGLRRHRGRMQPFGLQRQGGQRRAQLVRRVSNEAALAFHGRAGAAQQSVDGIHEGLKLRGQIGLRQRLQVMLLTGIDGAGQLRQRSQHQSDQHQHHRQQHGHQQQQGQRSVQGALPCNLITDASFL